MIVHSQEGSWEQDGTSKMSGMVKPPTALFITVVFKPETSVNSTFPSVNPIPSRRESPII